MSSTALARPVSDEECIGVRLRLGEFVLHLGYLEDAKSLRLSNYIRSRGFGAGRVLSSELVGDRLIRLRVRFWVVRARTSAALIRTRPVEWLDTSRLWPGAFVAHLGDPNDAKSTRLYNYLRRRPFYVAHLDSSELIRDGVLRTRIALYVRVRV